jgi:hypothetical protein
MSDSSFNIERATNGLVLALFLLSALFLGVMLYYVLQDIDERRAAPSDEATTAHVTAAAGAPSAAPATPSPGASLRAVSLRAAPPRAGAGTG